MSNKCKSCKGDPRGVLGFDSYSPCPDCNDLPLSGSQKDRAVYDLARVLEALVVAVNTPDDGRKRRKL